MRNNGLHSKTTTYRSRRGLTGLRGRSGGGCGLGGWGCFSGRGRRWSISRGGGRGGRSGGLCLRRSSRGRAGSGGLGDLLAQSTALKSSLKLLELCVEFLCFVVIVNPP